MMENNYSPLPENPPDCPIAPLANYALDARIVANYAPADGASLNGVHYTLSSPVNLPVANQRLDFSVTDSATLVIPTYYTNNSGALDVALTNTVPETVQLSAYLTADPSANTTSLLTFISNGIPETYELSSRTVVDGVPADNSGRNEVEFYLTYGGVGVSGNIIISDLPGHASIIRTTGLDGLYTADFTSSDPGSFTVGAQLQGDPSVYTSQTITFIPVEYPRYLGSNPVSIPAGVNFFGLQSLLGPFNIIADHMYTIQGIPSSSLRHDSCSLELAYIFDQPLQGCLGGIPNDYTHLAVNSITPVRALRSGFGADLHSPRYYYNNGIALNFTVQVWDEGPA